MDADVALMREVARTTLEAFDSSMWRDAGRRPGAVPAAAYHGPGWINRAGREENNVVYTIQLPAWFDGEGLASEVGWVLWPGTATAPSTQDGVTQIMVRPDRVDIKPIEEGNWSVAQRDFLGAFDMYTVDLGSGRRVQVMQSHLSRFASGARVRVSLRKGHSPQPFCNGRALGKQDRRVPWPVPVQILSV